MLWRPNAAAAGLPVAIARNSLDVWIAASVELPLATSVPTRSGKQPRMPVGSRWQRCFWMREIGRAHVRTRVTNAQLVCRLLLEKKHGVQEVSTGQEQRHGQG